MASVLRVVADTNIVMSAILSSRGAPAKLIDWMTREEDYFQLLLSDPIWDEYTTVAGWLIPPSRLAEKVRIVEALRLHSAWVEPAIRLHVCSDPADNRFLECAVTGHADYLVTKNIRHFPHKEFEHVRIGRIGEFLGVLEALAESE